MSARRNWLSNGRHCWRTWRSLRRFPGLFTLRDAFMQVSGVVWPMRFAYRRSLRALAREARIEPGPEGLHKVTLVERGLVFFWGGAVDGNLHYAIDQEFNERLPHCYTTPPVRLTPRSLVLDVGACEGLFACRVLKEGRAGRVIAFEPSARIARYARLAAGLNGVGDRLTVENMAVGLQSGRVRFVEGATPDGSRVEADAVSPGDAGVECVTLDDYCARHGLVPGREDLIKIDAEGWDFDVLRGAERIIRAGGPQIAVTTYHKPEHARQMVEWLQSVQPGYRLRLKGFASWTPEPTPVLLQAGW